MYAMYICYMCVLLVSVGHICIFGRLKYIHMFFILFTLMLYLISNSLVYQSVHFAFQKATENMFLLVLCPNITIHFEARTESETFIAVTQTVHLKKNPSV